MDEIEGAPQGAQAAQDTGKRKAEEIPRSSPKQAKKATPALVSLKNAKLSLRQKAVGWDRTMPVLRAVLAFQSYLAEHATQPLTDIPPEHLGVIASLTQESDKVDTELAKQIRAMLLPEGSEATTEAGEKVDTLSLQTIQNSVQSIATRVNYGMDDGPDDTAAPPSLQLWRWEVNNLDLLPKENLEKLLTRRKEREQAKLETLNLIKTLPADKYQALFQSKKRSTKAAPPISEPDAPSESTPSAVPEAPSKAPESPKPATPVKKEKSEKTKLRESRRAERQAKEEKEEKDKQVCGTFTLHAGSSAHVQFVLPATG